MSPSVRSASSLARGGGGDGVLKHQFTVRGSAHSDMDDDDAAAYCSILQGSPVWASSSSSPPSPSPSVSAREGFDRAADLAVSGSAVLIGEACTRAEASRCEEDLNLAVVIDTDARAASSSSASTNTFIGPETPSSSVNMLDATPGSGRGSPNLPSPIMEDACEWMNLDKVEHMGEGLDLEDVKPSAEALGLDASYHLHNSRRQNSCSEDAFMAQLDELLQSGTIGLGNDSAFSSVDDFFPAMSASHDLDLPPSAEYPASMEQWSMDSPREHDASSAACTTTDLLHPSGNVDHHDAGGESVIELFAQWLRSNAHCFSIGDLKKIKLKTSTIESATRRLGGGKKGLSQFLKFVLLWIQNCHMKRAGGSLSSLLDGHCFNSFVAGTGKSGCPMRDGPLQGETTYNVPMESVRPEKNSWSSLSQPASNPWRPRECNGGGFPVHNPSKASPYAVTASIPQVGSVNQAGWQRQQGNSASSMMCGGLRPSVQDRIGVYNSLSPTTASTSYSMASLVRPSTPAATTRAARKSRMERQRWSVRRHHHRSKAWAPSAAPSPTPSPSCATPSRTAFSSANTAIWPTQRSLSSPHMSSNLTSACDVSSRHAKPNMVDPLQQQGRKGEKNLRLLFQKELKQSDVGSLGRIVLPKKAAETSLPPLDLRDGVNLLVEDLNSPKMWTMRYRFWPNNKSRMYLLENTGDFVKSYDLKEGDYMMLYLNSSNNKYMIKGAKGDHLNSLVSSHDLGKTTTAARAPAINEFGYDKLDRSVSPKSCIDIFASDDSHSDDTLLAELIEQTLENVKDLPEILDVTS